MFFHYHMDRFFSNWFVRLTIFVFVAGFSMPIEAGQTGRIKQAGQKAGTIEKLIEQLGDPDWRIRQQASKRLTQQTHEAYPLLIAAAKSDDLEVRSRAKSILQRFDLDPRRPGDSPAVRDCLDGFLLLQNHEQKKRIDRLVLLPNDEGIPAIARLIRIENSAEQDIQPGKFSFYAIRQILENRKGAYIFPKPVAAKIVSELDGSGGEAGRWLRVYLGFSDDPAKALDIWNKMIWQKVSKSSVPTMASGATLTGQLLEKQLAWTLRLGASPELVRFLMKNARLRIDPARRDEIIDWIVREKVWDDFPGGLESFLRRGVVKPRAILYQVAQNCLDSDQAEKAEQVAQKAFELKLDRAQADMVSRYTILVKLADSGHLDWAERELQHILDPEYLKKQKFLDQFSGIFIFVFIEEYHDQQQYQKAIDLIDRILDDKRFAIVQGVMGNIFKARREYFAACLAEASGDKKSQRAHLEAALKIEPKEIDSLIAAYRESKDDPAWRAKVEKLIDTAQIDTEIAIRVSPQEADNYNIWAWLIGNTRGDFREAVRKAQKAVELGADKGGYLDTLGRCYYAAGDLEKAVDAQRRAVEKMPYSGLINAQWKFFSDKYEARHGKRPKEPVRRRPPLIDLDEKKPKPVKPIIKIRQAE
jgi:tetratricopeptide (TPR) repeat protein